MRLAYVITSTYARAEQLPTLIGVERDAAVLCDRLQAADAGYQVERLEADRDLPDRLRRSIAEHGAIQSLLLYVGGYGVLSRERGAALLLDAPRVGALSMPRLAGLLEGVAEQVLVLLDLRPFVDPGLSILEFVSAAGTKLTELPAVNALIAARPIEAGTEPEPSPLLGRWLEALGELSRRRAGTGAELEAVYARMLAAPGGGLLDLSLFAARTGFSLLVPPADAAPPVGDSGPHELAPELEPDRNTPELSAGEAEAARFDDETTAIPTQREPAAFDDITAVTSTRTEPPRFDDVTAVMLANPGDVDPPGAQLDSGVELHDRGAAPDAYDDLTEPRASVPPSLAAAPLVPDDAAASAAGGDLLSSFGEDQLPSFAAGDDAPPTEAEPMPAAGSFMERLAGSPPHRRESGVELRRLPEPAERAAPSPPPPAEPAGSEPVATPATEATSPTINGSGRPPPPAWTFSSPSSSTPPPLHSVEGSLAKGKELIEQGDHPGAVTELKRALFLLGSEKTPQRAEIYTCLADAQRRLGRIAPALNNYEKALDIEPQNAAALQGATELLCDAGDHGRAEELQRRRLELLAAPEERAGAFAGLVALWVERAGEPRRALPVIERWLSESPQSVEALGRAVEVHHALGQHAQAVAERRRQAELYHAHPEHQALLYAHAAAAIVQHLDDRAQAIELSLRSLELDPRRLDALELAARLFSEERDYARLAGAYETLIERTADPAVSLDLCVRLGKLCLRELSDPVRAVRAFGRAAELDPADPILRLELATACQAAGDGAQAARYCRSAICLAPRQPEVYRRASSVFERCGQADAAWNAAVILDFIGEADINESLLADSHRPEGLIAARDVLTHGDWEGALSAAPDPELGRVLAILREPARNLKIAALKKARQLPVLDEACRHDLEKSTTTLAKSLLWTARLLGLGAPALYVLPELEGDVKPAIAEAPAVLASRSLGSGLGLAELAFLWGRQLALFRHECSLLIFYPTPAELGTLVLGAFGATGRAAVDANPEAKRLAAGLKKRIDAPAMEALRAALQPLAGTDLTERTTRFFQSVELSGLRAGLVACGDVSTAARLSARFAGANAAAELNDLFTFAVSEPYQALRARLGVAVGA